MKTRTWRMHDQVISAARFRQPVDSRRGWSQEQLARYNRERFEDLVSAGWDLIIIDEAHRLGGSTEQVARFRLGDGSAQAAPYLLLLSATPHQGKSDAFRRLIGFLDEDALPGDDVISREAVAPFVIRTEKRRAIDADGNPLFKPRFTQLVPIEWGTAHTEQRALYEAVTEYVRDGYNRAIKEKQTAVGFLMILMQRLITSSTAAIRTALERRLAVLELPQGELSLFPEDVGEDWSSLDGQEQLDTVLRTASRASKMSARRSSCFSQPLAVVKPTDRTLRPRLYSAGFSNSGATITIRPSRYSSSPSLCPHKQCSPTSWSGAASPSCPSTGPWI